MAKSAGTLSMAMSRADKRVTVLDDKVDAEDHAAWLWMRAHYLSSDGHVRVVVGTEALSPGWIGQKRQFFDKNSAETYLHQFDRNHAAMHSLGTIAREVNPGSRGALSDADVVTTVAGSLASGRAWVIELPKENVKSRFIAKTDPAAFAPINAKYGSKVDFAYIATLEGDQALRGYVPIRSGVVAGKSGMTVASGFDIGQWSIEEIRKLNFSPMLVSKIKYFANVNFKDMRKPQVAAKVGKLAPVPVLTKAEADICDGAVFGKKLDDAIGAWNGRRSPGVPLFTAMPGGWQTVWLSRVYQGKAIAFGNMARAGKWQEAIAVLRSETEYPERTNQEADLLEKEMPPPLAPPVPRKPK